MTTEIRPLRSMLFVPGNKPNWMDKAERYKADALALDLEDSVPTMEKQQARKDVMDFIDRRGAETILFVRINDLGSRDALFDLQAIVRPGISGVIVPKVEGPKDIVLVERLLEWLEDSAGMELGTILINPVLETAAGIRLAFHIGSASERVAYMGGIGVRGGDEERALNYRWSSEGKETFVIRSQVLLDVRAAGVLHPMTGLWTDVSDLEGLRKFAQEGRDLGYEGMTVIHPSHVSVINDVFSPSQEEMQYWQRLLEAMESAEALGSAATVFEGQMVDTAMVKTARSRLAWGRVL